MYFTLDHVFLPKFLSITHFNLELIILSVSCRFSSCKFHIGLFIAPKLLPAVSNQLFSVLQSLNVRFPLLGDFNVNFLPTSHPCFSHLCNIIDSFSLTRCIGEATHTSPTGSSFLIDLCDVWACYGVLLY